jgi:hypothetical protein
VEEGGETYFNRLDLAVKPKKGRALVWPSVLDDNPEYWDKRMYVYLILLPRVCVCTLFSRKSEFAYFPSFTGITRLET